MKIVSENIGFRRGVSPKDALDIGHKYPPYNIENFPYLEKNMQLYFAKYANGETPYWRIIKILLDRSFNSGIKISFISHQWGWTLKEIKKRFVDGYTRSMNHHTGDFGTYAKQLDIEYITKV